jgi:hypothetical protein
MSLASGNGLRDETMEKYVDDGSSSDRDSERGSFCDFACAPLSRDSAGENCFGA